MVNYLKEFNDFNNSEVCCGTHCDKGRFHSTVKESVLWCIPTGLDANIRDINANIRANVAFTQEVNYSL